jgi:hypothetical protein
VTMAIGAVKADISAVWSEKPEMRSSLEKHTGRRVAPAAGSFGANPFERMRSVTSTTSPHDQFPYRNIAFAGWYHVKNRNTKAICRAGHFSYQKKR